MKTPRIKLFCLSMLAILTSITVSSAKEYEDVVNSEFPEMISEVHAVNYLYREADHNFDSKTVAAFLMNRGCTELRRVWVWSGWFPKRIWKRVSVACPQAAPVRRRGPGTTIPPH